MHKTKMPMPRASERKEGKRGRGREVLNSGIIISSPGGWRHGIVGTVGMHDGNGFSSLPYRCNIVE